MAADGYAAATRRVRLQVVDRMARHAGVEPDALRPSHVRDYLLAHPLKPWSRIKYLQHLRAWAEWTGGPDPTAGIRLPPQPRSLPDPLPEPELARLLAHLAERDHKLYTWALLGAYAGYRAHETAAHDSRHVLGGTLRLIGKGGRIDVLPVAPVLGAALAVYGHSHGPCWPGTKPTAVSYAIAREAASIGIRMRYHQLRHRFGTAVYRETRDLLLTMRLMRHSSPQTTAGYAAVAEAESNRVVSLLPGAGDPPEDVERMIS